MSENVKNEQKNIVSPARIPVHTESCVQASGSHHVDSIHRLCDKIHYNQTPENPTMKRLIVCCDGTWLDSAMGLSKGKLPLPSNVTRISQAIKPMSSEGFQQIVYYQPG